LDLEEEDAEEGHMLQLKLTTKLLFLDTYIYITQCGVVWCGLIQKDIVPQNITVQY